jgi:hypothetical protein
MNKRFNPSGAAHVEVIIHDEIFEFSRNNKLSKETVKLLEKRIYEKIQG